MAEVEAAQPRANRMFFLSIPPNVFVAASAGAADRCSSPTGEPRAASAAQRLARMPRAVRTPPPAPPPWL